MSRNTPMDFDVWKAAQRAASAMECLAIQLRGKGRTKEADAVFKAWRVADDVAAEEWTRGKVQAYRQTLEAAAQVARAAREREENA
jgi:hypothetical protein